VSIDEQIHRMTNTLAASDRTPAQTSGAFLAGALYGAAGGAALGGGTALGAGWGALVGALVLGAGEAVTDRTRVPGELKPMWWRVVAGTAIAAVIGWVAGLILPSWNLVIPGALFGLLFGLLGLRPWKLILGLAVGVIVGAVLEQFWPEATLPWVAAATLPTYRILASLIFREDQTEIMGERVPIREVEFVVPFAARQRYVGVDYLKEYADLTGADFVRGAPDIGILSRFDDLAGPLFDPVAAHPLIREFYEHTSRFHLSITPRWRWWMRPAYLLYRTIIAKPLGQANAPFDVDEVQEGVVSWIDAIDMDHSGEVDFRAWVRAYEKTMEPLYVGIYTVLRQQDTGYVSVGFPLPAANFTATLLPYANRGNGLLLKSRTDLSFPGHYLSAIDEAQDELSVIKLRSFDEEIDVYVEDDGLKTDHRFYLWGIEFMTLYYGIEPADRDDTDG
jgi:hypothetical protein